MTEPAAITFARLAAPKDGLTIIFVGEGRKLAESAALINADGVLERAFETVEFSGKFAASVDVIAPAGSTASRIIAIGTGDITELDEAAWMRLGGIAAHAANAKPASIFADVAGLAVSAENVAALAAGAQLRTYKFDKYKTRKGKDKENASDETRAGALAILCANPDAASKAFGEFAPAIAGTVSARDLVNEPANVMGPLEMVDAVMALEPLGVEVEILTEKEMRKLGMGALLGVAQGSSRPARLAIMKWSGGNEGAKPIAFVGKGVVFDTGGNSIKSAAGMEDMKGDMGGAAAVIGLMRALAGRKAKANIIGVVGLVENMVDGNAQRPGDIVRSMSGQTIEVLNTDAEGRLVLADALWYVNDRFKPSLIIDLATLTGAVMVALGQHYAGLFANDDRLAEQLIAAGRETQERLWRLPLGPEYDKMIDTRNADMKNTGGRYGGSITAAQFLQRFVKDVAWAHLDIAGTAIAAPSSDINQSWASGFGVRLLDRFVRNNHED